MAIHVLNLIGINELSKGRKAPRAWILHGYNEWPYLARQVYEYTIGCHTAHILEILVSVICYLTVFKHTFPRAHVWSLDWVAEVVAFNILCEFLTYGFWHWITYVSAYSAPLKPKKYNQQNQYVEPGNLTSPNGLLQREIFFTTLGWLQSSMYMCVMMHLWAAGYVSYYLDFWKYPAWSIFFLLLPSYWRPFHFYWVHRLMHPWWNRENGLKDGDVGAFLYRHVHSLHHKSYNPGPWSGLAMHPVEHLLYYTTALLPLVIVSHPLHFLYAKFHADISPLSSHDGYAAPASDGEFHYLHHAKFECNYGGDLLNFDWLFGTYVNYAEFLKAKGSLKESLAASRNMKYT